MILYDVLIGAVSLGIFISGISMRYWVGKRRFERRGVGGLQQFPSYSKALTITALERVVKWLSYPVQILGFLLLFFWIVFVRDNFRKTEKPKVEKVETKNGSTSQNHFSSPRKFVWLKQPYPRKINPTFYHSDRAVFVD